MASVQTSSGGSYGAADYVYTVGPGAINNVTERHLHTDTGADSWYYQYDHRGNVVAVTDYSGKMLRGYQYDAFGNIPFSFATGQSGAAPTDDILFTGKDLDPDTGLYYFNARWYDSQVGVFISRDPLSAQPSHLLFRLKMSIGLYAPHVFHTSHYAFTAQNPISRIDSDGQFLWGLIGGALVGALVGLATGGSLKSTACGALGGAVAGAIGAAIPTPFGVCLAAALGNAVSSFCNCDGKRPQGGWATLIISSAVSCGTGAAGVGAGFSGWVAAIVGDIVGNSLGTIGEAVTTDV